MTAAEKEAKFIAIVRGLDDAGRSRLFHSMQGILAQQRLRVRGKQVGA